MVSVPVLVNVRSHISGRRNSACPGLPMCPGGHQHRQLRRVRLPVRFPGPPLPSPPSSVRGALVREKPRDNYSFRLFALLLDSSTNQRSARAPSRLRGTGFCQRRGVGRRELTALFSTEPLVSEAALDDLLYLSEMTNSAMVPLLAKERCYAVVHHRLLFWVGNCRSNHFDGLWTRHWRDAVADGSRKDGGRRDGYYWHVTSSYCFSFIPIT